MRSRILNQKGSSFHWREIIREALHQLSRLFQYVNFQHKPSSLLLTRLRMRYYMVCVLYRRVYSLFLSLSLWRPSRIISRSRDIGRFTATCQSAKVRRQQQMVNSLYRGNARMKRVLPFTSGVQLSYHKKLINYIVKK